MFDSFKQVGGTPKQLLIGRVKKIVLGPKMTDNQADPDYTCEKDLGSIRYELLYSGKSNARGTKNNKPAYPIFGFVRQYPVVGEIVLMMSGPSANLNDSSQNQDVYYFPPFSIFNSPHLNAMPNMEEYSSYIKEQLVSSDNSDKDLSYYSLPVGATFVEKQYVKSLRPFEGDTIIQGRWGQSIRFGSTTPTLRSISPWSKNTSTQNNNERSGDPITMIVNSQRPYITNLEKDSPTTVEDINRDGSSIYMTSTQAILLNDINNFEIRSWKLNTSVDPNTNTVIVPEQPPISNDFLSPQEQDAKNRNTA
jgi:hypothetical protein